MEESGYVPSGLLQLEYEKGSYFRYTVVGAIPVGWTDFESCFTNAFRDEGVFEEGLPHGGLEFDRLLIPEEFI